MNTTDGATTVETSRRWYVTFHGGDAKHALNNIHAYTLDGAEIGTALAKHTLPKGVTLRELRGFSFGPDGNLYVVNAYRDYSQVLRFRGQPNAEGQHEFVDVFVAHHSANPGLLHPFHAAFAADGNLYVPSQDTNLVSRFYGPSATDASPGSPMPTPPALQDLPSHALHPGTFVPAAHHRDDGLKEVRHVLFDPDGHLYVADRGADSVKHYDGASGELLRTIAAPKLDKPIHLVLTPDGKQLLIGSAGTNAVVAYDRPSHRVAPFIAPGAGGLREPAGMAYGDDGKLYVASRGSNQILRYDTNGKPDPKPFLDGLRDHPEFLMLVGQP